MKLSIILGRGIEGSGITRCAIELENVLNKMGVENEVFFIDDKKWGRSKFQMFSKTPTAINKKNIEGFEKVLDKFDYNVVYSVPSSKHSQEIIDGFLKMFRNISTIKIIVNLDHKLQSCARNANFWELCKLADGIANHSITSPFFSKIVADYGEGMKKKFIHFRLGFDFDRLVRFRQEEHFKKITYLSRFAGFKDPMRMFGFLPFAKENDLLLEMKGVERSIGSLDMFYENKELRTPKIGLYSINDKMVREGFVIDDNLRDREHIYAFGPYDYEDGLKTVASSLVGADFYHLTAESYGDNTENAMCEIIACGAVPMFDYHWAENCHIYEKGLRTEKRFIDLDTYGLFVKKDLSNIPEVVDKINNIWGDKKLHKQYLECSYDVTKEHCDSNTLYEILLADIMKITKVKPTKKIALF
jgi:hypothetical protein